jgi:hypothetical protein
MAEFGTNAIVKHCRPFFAVLYGFPGVEIL